MVKEYSRQIVLRTQIGYFILIVSVLFIVYIFHFLLSVESPEISDPVSLEVTTNNGPQVIVVATASDGDEIEIPKLDPQEPIPFKPDAIYSNALLAEGSLSNIREKFDSHYELALRGNADSLLIIAEVIGNCLWVAPYDSLEEWEDGDLMQSSLVPEVYLIEIPKLIEGCGNGYINSHIPEGVEYDAWQAQWYKKAAEAGNIYAQLVVSSWEPRSEQNRQNRVELLNKAVRLEDYRAFYHAAQLHVDYFKYGVDDPENLTSHVWRYMGCIAHAGCDGSKYIAYLKEHYLLYDVETIQNAANRFSERIEDPTPLEFISAVSTDQIFVLDTDR